MSFVRKIIEEKYPKEVYKSMGGIFFLRFICPAIIAPHIFGLLTKPPAGQAQRALVLVCKAIQGLANEQKSGEKETYMEKINDFISYNRATLKEFLDTLSTNDFTPSPSNPEPITSELLYTAFAYMFKYLSDRREKVAEV